MARLGSDDGTDTPPIEEMHSVAAVDAYYSYHSPTEHSTDDAVETQTAGSVGYPGVPATDMVEEDGTTGVLVGSTTGGVTVSEMRQADLTFMAQMQSPWRAEQAVDTRLRDLLELRETHPATFVYVMSLFEERDASIRDLDQQIAERREQVTAGARSTSGL